MNSKHLEGTSFFRMDLEKGGIKSIKIPPINDITKAPPKPPTLVQTVTRQNVSLRSGTFPPNGFRYNLPVLVQ